MITIELNFEDNARKIELQDEILFNALLCQNEKVVKKLIKCIHPFYKIHDSFFTIINKYVDVTEKGVSLYGGLIVRTDYDEFAVLYLEGVPLDDDYIIKIVEEYLDDLGEKNQKDININKMEIDKSAFLRAIK